MAKRNASMPPSPNKTAHTKRPRQQQQQQQQQEEEEKELVSLSHAAFLPRHTPSSSRRHEQHPPTSSLPLPRHRPRKQTAETPTAVPTSRPTRKRFVWSQELNRDFTSAVFRVGLQRSSLGVLHRKIAEQFPQMTRKQVSAMLDVYLRHNATLPTSTSLATADADKRIAAREPPAGTAMSSVLSGIASRNNAKVAIRPNVVDLGRSIGIGGKAGYKILQQLNSRIATAGTSANAPSTSGGSTSQPPSSLSSTTSSSMQSVCQFFPESQLDAMMRTLNEATSYSHAYLDPSSPVGIQKSVAGSNPIGESAALPAAPRRKRAVPLSASKQSPRRTFETAAAAEDDSDNKPAPKTHAQRRLQTSTERSFASRQRTFMLPQYSPQQIYSQQGVAMGHLLGLYFALQQELLLKRRRRRQQQQQQHQHRQREQSLGRNNESMTIPATSTQRVVPLIDIVPEHNHIQHQQQQRKQCPLSKGRRNLEASDKLGLAMESQQAFRHQLHALKQQEVNKFVVRATCDKDGVDGKSNDDRDGGAECVM